MPPPEHASLAPVYQYSGSIYLVPSPVGLRYSPNEIGCLRPGLEASGDFHNFVGHFHLPYEVLSSGRVDERMDFLGVGQTLDFDLRTDKQAQWMGRLRCIRLDVADRMAADLEALADLAAAGTDLDTGPAGFDHMVLGTGHSQSSLHLHCNRQDSVRWVIDTLGVCQVGF